MHKLEHFFAFKMAVAIAFLCENAVEAIEVSNHGNKINLNCFYGIFAKKQNSHAMAILNT